MASVIAALRRVKDDLPTLLEPQVIDQECERLGHVWRAGPLDPATTVALFVQQVACGNLSCAAVRHHADEPFTPSAYCQARQRLPLDLLHRLGEQVRRRAAAWCEAEPDGAGGDCRGHPVKLIDGSSFSMPDTPALQAHFGQPSEQAPGCGFPVAQLLAQFDRSTGLLTQPLAAPLNTSELRHVPDLHARLQPGDLVLGDRLYCSYGHVALLAQRGLHVVVPNHASRIVSFKVRRRHARPKGGRRRSSPGLPSSRWIRRLGPNDQLVEWFKPPQRPAWIDADTWTGLPASLVVREIRRQVQRPGWPTLDVIVVTTLLDPRTYPADELVELRLQRWEVETNLRHLKTTLGMDVLKCQTVDGVLKELAVFVLVYNLVRLVMLQAARRQGVPVPRISFADTLAWLVSAGPGDALPALVVNPDRRYRREPRVVKRRPKAYPRMTQPRAVLRRALRDQAEAA